MNLIIDVGNTLIKAAIFDKDVLLEKEDFNTNEFMDAFPKWVQSYLKIKHAIIASVGKLDALALDYLEQNFELLKLNQATKMPFSNRYKTPETLGVDRMALVSASVYHFSEKNVLVIDAGSCITYDFITDKNDYLGGAISPGVEMRYRALHSFTANLPLLKKEEPSSLIGDSTKASMHSGVVNGVINEIEGAIETYTQKYSDLTVILTGGDGKFLSKQLKSSIFANSNFLLEGLNYILQFNLD